MKKLFLILLMFISLVGYSQIPVMGNIEPYGTGDTYPVVLAEHVQGGFMSLATIAMRDDYDGTEDPTGLTMDRRTEGMLVYVRSTGLFYQLQGGIANLNWVQVPMGSDILLGLDDHVFDTIRLFNNDTKIWQLRLSVTGDTLFYNDEVFVSGAGSGASLPSLNIDRPINFIANATNIANVVGYSPMRIDSLIEKVFYASLPPQAAISGAGSIYEYGSSNNISLSWTATKTSNPIAAITVAGTDVIPTGNTQSGTSSQVVTSINKVFSILVVDDEGLSATATKTYYFRDRLYVGLSATNNPPPHADFQGITDATINAYPYKELVTAYSPTTMITLTNPSGAYVVVCAPSYFGQPKSWPDGGSSSQAITCTLQKTWNHVNLSGYTTEYKMWVIPNKQTTNPLKIYFDEKI